MALVLTALGLTALGLTALGLTALGLATQWLSNPWLERRALRAWRGAICLVSPRCAGREGSPALIIARRRVIDEVTGDSTMALFSTRSWGDWVAEYERAHRHPVNRLSHTFGIPIVAASVALAPVSIVVPPLRLVALVLFIVGWVLQFTGHAFEGKPPEFFKDWRFLFVGLRWWFMKVLGRGSAQVPPAPSK